MYKLAITRSKTTSSYRSVSPTDSPCGNVLHATGPYRNSTRRPSCRNMPRARSTPCRNNSMIHAHGARPKYTPHTDRLTGTSPTTGANGTYCSDRCADR
jgi:hypothetical protein